MSPCPLCSFYRRDHPELPEDSLCFPVMVKSARAGKVILLGSCEHIRKHFGPHEDEEQADVSWECAVIDLQKEKLERRRQLSESLERIKLLDSCKR